MPAGQGGKRSPQRISAGGAAGAPVGLGANDEVPLADGATSGGCADSAGGADAEEEGVAWAAVGGGSAPTGLAEGAADLAAGSSLEAPAEVDGRSHPIRIVKSTPV